MRRLDRIPWFRGTLTADDALDVDVVLAEGLRDPATARRAGARLKRERKALACQRKNAHRRSSLLTPGKVRIIGRSSPGSPDLETYQLARAMREAGATDQAATFRAEQLAAIEERLWAIDRAVAQLNASR